MPEGHSIHRAARLQAERFAGQPLAVSSPQGRASETAAVVDGQTLASIDAHGKHLFYRFEDVPDALHVHLGLFGRFFEFTTAEAPEPRPGIRLRFEGDAHVLEVMGPTAATLIDPEAENALLGRLGVDPLDPDADPEPAFRALRKMKVPIAQALVDQSIFAGVGNAFRAEILNELKVYPLRPARAFSRDELERLWETTVDLMRRGEEAGEIADKRVYKLDACSRCGTPVKTRELGKRPLFWCPRCQPGRRPRA